jgi:hypothetical protein
MSELDLIVVLLLCMEMLFYDESLFLTDSIRPMLGWKGLLLISYTFRHYKSGGILW